METSLQLAGILGPVLIALSVTEYLNFKIWADIHPTVVYLNGLVLLVGGLIVVRMHNNWAANWTVLITLLGWLIMLLGLVRMIFPTAKQAQKHWSTNLLLLTMFIVGVFLTVKGYWV